MPMCGTWGARRPTTHIRSQRARLSSVGKTPSFSFCQVDMYDIISVNVLDCDCVCFVLPLMTAE